MQPLQRDHGPGGDDPAGRRLTDRAGNLEPRRIYPDQLAPIIRNGAKGPELVKARWSMPSPHSVLRTELDPA